MGMGVLFAALFAVSVLAALFLDARSAYRVVRRMFTELPADAVLLDMARALLAALRDVGAVSPNLQDAYVRAVENEWDGIQVFLDYASPEDSATFASAFREMMGPLGDARYIIERNSASMRNLVYRPLWRVVRVLWPGQVEVKAYHRVPGMLAARRRDAEKLAAYWRKYVGGGRLIYTRSPEGRDILLRARAQQRKRVRQMAFELWR